jgi:hypothetical protein
MFPDFSFDFETRSKMTRALDDAMLELRIVLGGEPLDAAGTREKLARRITAAALRGERDPKQLKLTALGIKKN